MSLCEKLSNWNCQQMVMWYIWCHLLHNQNFVPFWDTLREGYFFLHKSFISKNLILGYTMKIVIHLMYDRGTYLLMYHIIYYLIFGYIQWEFLLFVILPLVICSLYTLHFSLEWQYALLVLFCTHIHRSTILFHILPHISFSISPIYKYVKSYL